MKSATVPQNEVSSFVVDLFAVVKRTLLQILLITSIIVVVDKILSLAVDVLMVDEV